MKLYNIILAVWISGQANYIGSFNNLDSCIRYTESFYPEQQYSCLHRNFINLPKDLKEKFMIEHKDNWSEWETTWQ